MYDPSLTRDAGLGSIGGIGDVRVIRITPDGKLTRSLRRVHDGIQHGRHSSRAEATARRHWVQTGIPLSIRDHLARLGMSTTPTLPLSAYEWTQNAVEHGAQFAGTVDILTVLGDEGVLISITDGGGGFAMEERLTCGSLLYESPGYGKRGYGLHGAVEARDVSIGFEKLPTAFRTLLLTHREHIERVLRQDACMLAAARG